MIFARGISKKNIKNKLITKNNQKSLKPVPYRLSLFNEIIKIVFENKASYKLFKLKQSLF